MTNVVRSIDGLAFRAKEHEPQKRTGGTGGVVPGFVAASPVMRDILNQIRQIAEFDIPVLLLGESGTGKGIVANMIHELSCRAPERFMKINCAALPSELLESELFGYEAGAFTGAAKAKAGKFEACHRGTIFLDEIAEMPIGLQAKLLHVLQDGEFSRLGSYTPSQVDVRVIAATNTRISQAIAAGTFRRDLYYRLNVYTICLPPLRERREDIPALLEHFIDHWSEQIDRPPLPVSRTLLGACMEYPWPGNIRELENFVRRYLIIGDENQALGQLQQDVTAYASSPVPAASPAASAPKAGPGDLKEEVRRLKEGAEKMAITRALSLTGGNRTEAARLLHISVRALQYKIRNFGVESAGLRAKPEPAEEFAATFGQQF
ncbi:MAG TPA: sigma 54-interacting transcriptional regulator [Terriglobia bacterium]|nr:sigma 54-interacting transcriptional regulator [Terriglobia bacterium]